MLARLTWRALAWTPLAWAALLGLAYAQTTPPAQPDSAQPLHLMTWNVGTINPFGARLPIKREVRVIRAIALEAPEVVTLQEVRSREQALRLAVGLRALGHRYRVVATINDTKRKDGKMSATLFRTSYAGGWLLPLLDRRYFVHALRLRGFTVVNVHGPSVGGHKQRRTFYRELVDLCERLPQPVVLAGDFNLGPTRGAGFSAFLPWARKIDRATFAFLSDAFDHQTNPIATTGYFMRIDHVMVDGGRVVDEQRLMRKKRFPMDHFPVVVHVSKAAAAVAGSRRGAVGALR